MIEIEITQSQILRAEMLYKFKELNNSIRKGEGNLIGSVGEIVVFDYYQNKGREVEHCQHPDFDLMIEGFKVEIKTQETNKTQETKFKPLDWFTCHVSDYNATQDCDFYCFPFVNKSMTTAWLAGMIKKNDFKERAVFKREGEIGHKKPFLCDTWTVRIDELTKIV
jgi:hypothetical protein